MLGRLNEPFMAEIGLFSLVCNQVLLEMFLFCLKTKEKFESILRVSRLQKSLSFDTFYQDTFKMPILIWS